MTGAAVIILRTGWTEAIAVQAVVVWSDRADETSRVVMEADTVRLDPCRYIREGRKNPLTGNPPGGASRAPATLSPASPHERCE